MQKFMADNGYKNVAIVTDLDAFNFEFGKFFESQAPANGLNIVAFEKVAIGIKDFRTLILKLKNYKPDAVLIEMQDTSQNGPFMRQAKELKLNIKTFSSAGAENEDNLKSFPGQFEGFLYTFPKPIENDLYKDAVRKYEEKYGKGSKGPSFLGAYNATVATLAVLNQGARTGTEIRDALYKLNIPGIGIERLTFDKNGQNSGSTFEIKTVRNDQFVPYK